MLGEGGSAPLAFEREAGSLNRAQVRRRRFPTDVSGSDVCRLTMWFVRRRVLTTAVWLLVVDALVTAALLVGGLLFGLGGAWRVEDLWLVLIVVSCVALVLAVRKWLLL